MKKYWSSIEEFENGHFTNNSEDIQKKEIAELIEHSPIGTPTSRRNFLKLMGYSVAGTALLAACKKPVQNTIPFLIQPPDIVPGKASYFASTFFDGSEYCPIVVKVRDGRPIKIEGNELFKYIGGGSTSRVQASIISLYDNARIRNSLKGNKEIPWEEADKEIIAKLQNINKSSKEIVLLTSSIFSPTTIKAINEFKKAYSQARVVYYDVPSYSGLIEAYTELTGKSGIPYPLFDQADLIVNFGSDFLGTWLMPAEFTNAYSSKRRVEKGKFNMSRHIQFESELSLTGSNADERIQIKPSEESTILINLYNLIAAKSGVKTIKSEPARPDLGLEKIAAELFENKGRSLILSGSNDKNIQSVVIAINYLLGNYGKTFDLQKPILVKKGLDNDLFGLIDRMNSGKVGAILFNNSNPSYDFYDPEEFSKALKKVDLKISFSGFPNETLLYCDFVCPDSHFLESWNDFEPRTGVFSIAQPCISKIFNTRQMPESLLKWSGNSLKWEDYLKANWKSSILSKEKGIDSEKSWIEILRNGIFETNDNEKLIITGVPEIKPFSGNTNKKAIELKIVVPVTLSTEYHSNNPWLHELPDPVSKVTWENFASVSPRFAEEQKLKTGDMIRINDKIEIPVLVQPGHAYGVISAGLNYGRSNAGKVAEKVGVNVYSLVNRNGNNFQYFQTNIRISKTEKSTELAMTQTFSTMAGRAIVKDTTLKEYKENPKAGNESDETTEKKHISLYRQFKYDNYHWGIAIDLNACTGCGACTIACQAENNIAVVGKEQVLKKRVMHWIRIDRYYSGDPEKPSVLFQPMLCQHCDNAPCENVCPVAATTHNNEGLNQMTYNRCVGTRYCINNCPYKVRRFNFLKFVDNPKFDYNQNSKMGKLVLNPDVVVRERGVVEKCTFCVQRIQDKKLQAKIENRGIRDGEIQPACVQACSARAMVFGDLNDPKSEVSKIYQNERNYFVLEELHTVPKIGYLTKVRNNSEA